MQQYIARRLLLFIPTVLLVASLVFFLLRVIPGDPAVLILAGTSGEGTFTQEQLGMLQQQLGTDKPLHSEYGLWIWNLLRGDLGDSYVHPTPITEQLKDRIPVTLELALLAMIFTSIIAVPLGLVSALTRDTLPDYIARVVSFSGIAIPTFVGGIVTIYLLVRIFDWFPPVPYATPWEDPGKNIQQMIFPALILAFFMTSYIARVTRSALLEVLREDYVRTARAKGLPEQRVILTHALKNAFLPVLTTGGWAFGVLLGGSVIVEDIFLLPGIGQLLLESIFGRDYPTVQALVLIVAAMILLLNLAIDVLYAWFDPRIRFT